MKKSPATFAPEIGWKQPPAMPSFAMDAAGLGACVTVVDARPGILGVKNGAKARASAPAVQMILAPLFAGGERLLAALKAGDCVFIIPSVPLARPSKVLPATYPGEMSCLAPRPPQLVRASRTGSTPKKSRKLSPREREVLDLLAQGLIYREIGDRLMIGPETVRSHLKSICHKMNARGRLEAVARHVRNELEAASL